MTSFPLIARYLPGLKIWFDSFNSTNFVHYVNAEDLEAVLAKGIQLHGYVENSAPDHWRMTKVQGPGDTHCGLLIGIQEIRPESAEDLLRERLIALELRDKRGPNNISPQEREWCNKTRAFLERRGENG